jgi:hypothetical protein
MTGPELWKIGLNAHEIRLIMAQAGLKPLYCNEIYALDILLNLLEEGKLC